MAKRKRQRRRNRQNLVQVNPSMHNDPYHPTACTNNAYHSSRYNNNNTYRPTGYNTYRPTGYNTYRPYPSYRPYDFSLAPTTFSSSSFPPYPVIARQFSATPMAPTVPVVTIHNLSSLESERTHVVTTNTIQEPDDDVVYLYTVSGGQLVEVVDLGEDAEGRELNSSTRTFVLTSEQDSVSETASNENTSVSNQISRQDVVCISDNSKDATVKPAVKETGTKKRKRDSLGEARCVVCRSNYEEITEKKEELFSSRCGHLFCMACLKHLIPYKCTVCKIKISHLWKIYL